MRAKITTTEPPKTAGDLKPGDLFRYNRAGVLMLRTQANAATPFPPSRITYSPRVPFVMVDGWIQGACSVHEPVVYLGRLEVAE